MVRVERFPPILLCHGKVKLKGTVARDFLNSFFMKRYLVSFKKFEFRRDFAEIFAKFVLLSEGSYTESRKMILG